MEGNRRGAAVLAVRVAGIDARPDGFLVRRSAPDSVNICGASRFAGGRPTRSPSDHQPLRPRPAQRAGFVGPPRGRNGRRRKKGKNGQMTRFAQSAGGPVRASAPTGRGAHRRRHRCRQGRCSNGPHWQKPVMAGGSPAGGHIDDCGGARLLVSCRVRSGWRSREPRSSPPSEGQPLLGPCRAAPGRSPSRPSFCTHISKIERRDPIAFRSRGPDSGKSIRIGHAVLHRELDYRIHLVAEAALFQTSARSRYELRAAELAGQVGVVDEISGRWWLWIVGHRHECPFLPKVKQGGTY